MQCDVHGVPRPAQVAHLLTPLQSKLRFHDIDGYIDAVHLSTMAFQQAKAAYASAAISRDHVASGMLKRHDRPEREIELGADIHSRSRSPHAAPSSIARLARGRIARNGAMGSTNMQANVLKQQRVRRQGHSPSQVSTAHLQDSVQTCAEAAPVPAFGSCVHALAEFLDVHVNRNTALSGDTMSEIIKAIQRLGDDMKVCFSTLWYAHNPRWVPQRSGERQAPLSVASLQAFQQSCCSFMSQSFITQVQASGILIRLGMYFCAIQCVELVPVLLKQVLNEVYLLVKQKCFDAHQTQSWRLWLWDELDRNMLIQTFGELEIIRRYQAAERCLKRTGPKGLKPLVRLERHLLYKVHVVLHCAALFAACCLRALLQSASTLHMCMQQHFGVFVTVAQVAPM
jgi:hypothetical protein